MQWEHLQDYDMNMPNFMCYGGRKFNNEATSSTFPKKSTPGNSPTFDILIKKK